VLEFISTAAIRLDRDSSQSAIGYYLDYSLIRSAPLVGLFKIKSRIELLHLYSSMLCEQCQHMLAATSERVLIGNKWRFKHHENTRAFQASTEAGCQLCLMFWYQLSSEIRRVVVEENPRSSARDTDTDTVVHEAAGPISYTIGQTLRDRGRYDISIRINIGNTPVSLRLDFVRAEGL
jgi:hypothetical protein